MARKTTPLWIKELVRKGELPPQKEFKKMRRKR